MGRRQIGCRVGVVTICLSTTTLLMHAQNSGAQRTRDSATTINRAKAAVDKSAAEHHVAISDAAKQELAIEVAREQVAAPKSAAAGEPSPEAKIDRIFTQTDLANHGAVDVSDIKRSIAADRSTKVLATLENDAVTQTKAAGLTLPPEVKEHILQDLQRQTAGLAASGLPPDQIAARNQVYIKAIADRLHDVPVTPTSYNQARQEIFQQFVKMRIESVPVGASVRMNDVEIGRTDISEQPLEPGKEVQFDFTLAGYRPAHRSYYVPAGVLADRITEPLAPDKPSSTGSLQGDTTNGNTFPYLYVVIGLLILGGLVLFARRR